MPDPKTPATPAPQPTAKPAPEPVNELARQGLRIRGSALIPLNQERAQRAQNARTGQVQPNTPAGVAVAKEQQDDRNLFQKTVDFFTNAEGLKYDTTLLEAQVQADPFSFDYANRVIVRPYAPGEREQGGFTEWASNTFAAMLTGAASGMQSMWHGAKEGVVAMGRRTIDNAFHGKADLKAIDELYNGIVENHKASKIVHQTENQGIFDSISSFSAAVGEQIPLLAASFATAGVAAELGAGAKASQIITSGAGAIGGYAQTMASLSLEAAENGIRPTDALPYIQAASLVSGLLEGAGDYIGVGKMLAKELRGTASQVAESSAREALQRMGKGEVIDLTTHYVSQSSAMKKALGDKLGGLIEGVAESRLGQAARTGFAEGFVEELPQQYVEDAAKNMYNYFKGRNQDEIGNGLFNTPGIDDSKAMDALRSRELWGYMSNTLGSSEQLEQGIYAGLFGAIFGGGLGAVMYNGRSPVLEQTTFGYIDSANREDLRRGDGQPARRDAALNVITGQLQGMLDEGQIDQDTFDEHSRKISDMVLVSDMFNNNQMNGQGATTANMRAIGYDLLQKMRNTQSVVSNWDSNATRDAITAAFTTGDPAVDALKANDMANNLSRAQLEAERAKEMTPIIQQMMGELGTSGKFDIKSYNDVIAGIQAKSYEDYNIQAPTSGTFEGFLPVDTFQFDGSNYAVSDRMDVAKMDDNGNYARLGQLESEQALGEYNYQQNERRILLDEIGEQPMTDEERADVSSITGNPTLRSRIDQAVASFNAQLDQDAINQLSGATVGAAGTAAPQALADRVNQLTDSLNSLIEGVIGGTQEAVSLEQYGALGNQIGKARMKGEYPLFRKQLTLLLKSLKKGAMPVAMFNNLSFNDQAELYRIVNSQSNIADRQTALNDLLQRNNINLDRNAATERIEDEKAEVAGRRVEASLKGIEEEQRAIDQSISDLERQAQLANTGGQVEAGSIEGVVDEIRRRVDSATGTLETENGRLSADIEESPDFEASDREADAGYTGADQSAIAAEPGTTELPPSAGADSAGTVTSNTGQGLGSVTSPDFFLSTPNRDGSWLDARRETTYKPDAHAYDFQIDPNNPGIAEFSMSNDPSLHSDAVRFPETFIDPVAERLSNIASGERIVNMRKGKARLLEGKWVVTEKAEVMGQRAFNELQRQMNNAMNQMPTTQQMTTPSRPIPPSQEVIDEETSSPDHREGTSFSEAQAINEQRAITAMYEMTAPEASMLGRALAMAIPTNTIVPSSQEAFNNAFRKLKGNPDAVAPTFGFVSGNTVYLNPERLNTETPIHEHGHLWVAWAEQVSPERYTRGRQLVMSDDALMAQVKQWYPDLSGEELVKEAMAQIIGQKGAAILDSKGGFEYIEDIVNPNFLTRMSNWMGELWNSIKDFFGLHTDSNVWDGAADMTLDQFASAVASDLLAGKQITDLNIEQPGVAEHTGWLPGETEFLHRDRRFGVSDFREQVDPDNLVGKNPLVIYNMLRNGYDPLIEDLKKLPGEWGPGTEKLYASTLMDVAKYASAGGKNNTKYNPSPDVKQLYKKLQLGNPRSEASTDKESGLFKAWKRWYEYNYYSDAEGNRRFLDARKEQLDMRSKWNLVHDGVVGKASQAMFHLGNMNLETFAEYNGIEGSAIHTIGIDLKRAGGEALAEIALHDKQLMDPFMDKMEGLSTFRRKGNPSATRRIEFEAYNSGRLETVSLPVGVVMDLIGNFKSQFEETGTSSILYNDDPDAPANQTFKKDQQQRYMQNGYQYEDPTSRSGDRIHHIMMTQAQYDTVAAYFDAGGEFAEQFQLVSDMYNSDERFGMISRVYEQVVGRKMLRPKFYWPTQAVSDTTSETSLRGAGMLIDQLGFFNDREESPGKNLQGYDAVERAYNHNRKVHNFVGNANLVDSLATWQDNVLKQEGRTIAGVTDRSEYVKDLLRDINSVSGRKTYSKIDQALQIFTRAATTAAFSFNPLTPMIQTAGYSVALGQGVIEDKYLLRAAPALFGRVGASYAGYIDFRPSSNPMESFWAEENVLNRIRAAQPYGSSAILYRLEGDVEPSISGVNLNELEDWMDQATKGSVGKLASSIRAVKNFRDWINERGLSAMYRSDRAVFLAFWEAAEMQVKDRMGTIETADAQREIARLATEIAYKTNSMSMVADKTALQRSPNPINQMFGIFSAQQQKVTNLLFQRFSQYRESPTTDNLKRFWKTFGIGILFNAFAVAWLRDKRDEAKGKVIQLATGSGTQTAEEIKIAEESRTRDLVIGTLDNVLGGTPGIPNALVRTALSFFDSKPFITDALGNMNLGASAFSTLAEGVADAVNRHVNKPDTTPTGRKRKPEPLATRSETKKMVRGAAQLMGISGFLSGIATDIAWPRTVRGKKIPLPDEQQKTGGPAL